MDWKDVFFEKCDDYGVDPEDIGIIPEDPLEAEELLEDQLAWDMMQDDDY